VQFGRQMGAKRETGAYGLHLDSDPGASKHRPLTQAALPVRAPGMCRERRSLAAIEFAACGLNVLRASEEVDSFGPPGVTQPFQTRAHRSTKK